jgi:hypothetical protein
VGSRFHDWIYWTSLLQLHLIITVHTLNSFLITNLSLYLFLISDWPIVSRLLLSSTSESESLQFTKAPPFITSGGPNALRSHYTEQFIFLSPAPVVAETPGDPKIPRIHRNVCGIFDDMRMPFRELLPSKRSLHRTVHLSISCTRCSGNAWWSQDSPYPPKRLCNIRWYENAF